eukprot:5211397-Pleurochrysis_carterae.AAC.1
MLGRHRDEHAIFAAEIEEMRALVASVCDDITAVNLIGTCFRSERGMYRARALSELSGKGARSDGNDNY